MKYTFTLSLALTTFSSLGQVNYFPYISDLKGKINLSSVKLEKYEVRYNSNKHDSSLILIETVNADFDARGNIITSRSKYVNSVSRLTDSVVYNSNNNVVASYRYLPDGLTLESLEELVYEGNGKLVERILYNQEGELSSTYTLIQRADKYEKYEKKFKDGLKRFMKTSTIQTIR